MMKVFLGYPACRDEKWLHLSLAFTINVFATSFALRMLPPFLRGFGAFLLPTRWWIRGNLKEAEKLIIKLIEEHAARAALNSRDTHIQGAEDVISLLDWMMENAQGNEAEPQRLAARQLILTLASVHTTSLALSHAFYDLCAHPEYIAPLRAELFEALKQPGGLCKRNLEQLHKMESFLAESQRLNPPVLCTYLPVQRFFLTISQTNRAVY